MILFINAMLYIYTYIYSDSYQFLNITVIQKLLLYNIFVYNIIGCFLNIYYLIFVSHRAIISSPAWCLNINKSHCKLFFYLCCIISQI